MPGDTDVNYTPLAKRSLNRRTHFHESHYNFNATGENPTSMFNIICADIERNYFYVYKCNTLKSQFPPKRIQEARHRLFSSVTSGKPGSHTKLSDDSSRGNGVLKAFWDKFHLFDIIRSCKKMIQV